MEASQDVKGKGRVGRGGLGPREGRKWRQWHILPPFPGQNSQHGAAWTCAYEFPGRSLSGPIAAANCPLPSSRLLAASICTLDTIEAVSVLPHHSAGLSI